MAIDAIHPFANASFADKFEQILMFIRFPFSGWVFLSYIRFLNKKKLNQNRE